MFAFTLISLPWQEQLLSLNKEILDTCIIYKTQLYPQKPPVNLKDFELRFLQYSYFNMSAFVMIYAFHLVI